MRTNILLPNVHKILKIYNIPSSENGHVGALFADGSGQPALNKAKQWILNLKYI